MAYIPAKIMCLNEQEYHKKVETKIEDYLGYFATRDKAIEKLKIVLKEFKKAKTVAFKLRQEFIDEYIERRDKDCIVSLEIMKKMFQRED